MVHPCQHSVDNFTQTHKSIMWVFVTLFILYRHHLCVLHICMSFITKSIMCVHVYRGRFIKFFSLAFCFLHCCVSQVLKCMLDILCCQ